jgi:hypothetical protein
MPAPDDWLDRPLHVINVGRRGYAPLTWRDDWGLAGLAFSDPELARRHAERAGGTRRRATAGGAAGARRSALTVLDLAASDLRAREEWLQAVLNAGAARVAFDLPAGGPPPLDTFELTGALLAEVLSHKRGTACL